MVVNTSGGQGALSLKLRGIFESGIKDYDDVALKVPLDTAQRIMGTDGVSKVLILLNNNNVDAFMVKLKNILLTIICRWLQRTGKKHLFFINRLRECSQVYIFLSNLLWR